jgi:type I restriction enzyme S subunit
MTNAREIELGELMPKEGRGSVNPADYPGEVFELLSIPAYDRGSAEIALGSEIGSTKQAVQPGDVLISKIVPHIRRAWVVEPSAGSRQIASSEWIVFRSKDVDARYLRHFLVSDGFHRQFMQTVSGVGGSLLRARPKYVAKIKIPLPPLEEQRRIAAILDKAGQILSSSRQADALRQHLQVRLFISMFGDPRSNPLGLPRLSIEAITSDYVGGAALAPEDFVDQGTPVLHKGAIKAGGRIEVDSKKKGFVTPQTAQYHQRSLAGPGKVAVTLRDLLPSGPFIGLMADLSTTEIPEFLLAQGAYAFSVDTRKILPGYLIALVNMPTFRLVLRQNAVGSTQIHIRLPVFKSIEIPAPPIEKQHEFTRIISRISSIGVSSQARIQCIDELTRSLQSSFH